MVSGLPVPPERSKYLRAKNLELFVAEAFGIEAGSLGLLSVDSKWFVLVSSEEEYQSVASYIKCLSYSKCPLTGPMAPS